MQFNINLIKNKMGNPAEQNQNEGRGTGGNATGKQLYPGELKDKTFRVIVVLVVAVLVIAIAVVIFN